MQYTQIGGRSVSNISLGTVQLGLNYGIANQNGKPSREASFAMLEAALSHGITALDTARGYGDSELVLGDFFRSTHKTFPFLTTKLTSTLPAQGSQSEIEKAIVQSVESSLERLGLSRVDCLLLHKASDMQAYGRIVPDTLGRLIKDGYIGMAGVSVYYPEEVDCMLQDDIYTAIQIPLNIFDQRLIRGGQLNRLLEKGTHVFVRSVFFQGLFFLDPDTMQEPALQVYAAPYIKKLQALAARSGLTVAQLAAAFVRDLPGVTSLVLGADTPAQVVENTALMNVPPLDSQLLEETLHTFGDVNYEGIMDVLRRPRPQPAP